MNKETLSELYPLVFKESKLDSTCGHGWDLLLECVFEAVNRELGKLPEGNRDFSILVIREKYGRLRISYEGSYSAIRQIIIQAEDMSEHICENCGEYGSLRDSAHWIKVRCDACEDKHFVCRNLSPEAKAALFAGIKSAKELSNE
jgi:hypothetical protein